MDDVWRTIATDAASDDPERKRRAHDAVISAFQPLVHTILRARHGNDRADDLTQEFFAKSLLSGGLIARIPTDNDDAEIRRVIRSLLVRSANNFAVDVYRRDGAQYRNGEIRSEDGCTQIAPTSPDATLRAWAVDVLQESLRRVEDHFRDEKVRYWDAFVARVLRPAVQGSAPPALKSCYRELGYRTPNDASAAVSYVTERIAHAVRDVLMEQAATTEELDELTATFRRSIQSTH